MKRKDIKRSIVKQLKKECPHWNSLKRKEKKALAKEVALAVIENYDDSLKIKAPIEELLGVQEQTEKEGIIPLEKMGELINEFHRRTVFDSRKLIKLRVNLKDPFLRFVDEILNDQIIGKLLWYKGYSPQKKEFTPALCFRAELLKAIKYPEISYRKFCAEEYMGMERKENKEFLGLPLHKNKFVSHELLSKFRASLSFAQITNLMVYILHHVKKSGILDNCLIHGVDSTELFNENTYPLFTVNVGGKKVRIYSDLDSDCGIRRNKRSKSNFFIGYRMHTLTAIDSKTGHNFPLASIFAAGNHHDSLLLQPLIELAQAMGIEMKLITADEAYHDNEGELLRKTGVELVTPATESVKLPENVDPETFAVSHNVECEIPMEHLGCFEGVHEFKCTAQFGECLRSDSCPQSRFIPTDRGVFQNMMTNGDLAKQSIEIRKNIERPFNLLKHCHGLERVRVRCRKSLVGVGAFATIASLLVEMERRCNDREKDSPQINIFDQAS